MTNPNESKAATAKEAGELLRRSMTISVEALDALATLEALAEENAALKREVERLNGAYKWLSQTNTELVEMREKAEGKEAKER